MSTGVFGQTEIEWSRKVRTTFGLRGDVYHWNVVSNNPLNSGERRVGHREPEGVGRVRSVEGHRSSTPTGDSASTPTRAWASRCRSIRSPAIRPTGLAGVRAGARVPRSAFAPWPFEGLQTTATVWYLGFDSELVYVGDSGSTEAGPASRRRGVEITNYVVSRTSGRRMDVDLSFSRARFVGVPAGEDFVPGALNRVISAGIAVNPPAGVSAGAFGSVRLRHFGPRPLIEDNSVRSKSTSILNGEIGYKFSDRIRAER